MFTEIDQLTYDTIAKILQCYPPSSDYKGLVTILNDYFSKRMDLEVAADRAVSNAH